MGSLVKKEGRFYLDISDARRTPKRKRIRIRVRTRRDAESVRAGIERAYALGEYDPWKTPQWPPVEGASPARLHASTSLADATRAFLLTKRTLRKATRDHYRWVLEAFSSTVSGDPPVSSIDESHLAVWLGATTLSDHSVHTYWKSIKVFFRWLERQGVSVGAEGFTVSRPCEKLSCKLITPSQVRLLANNANHSSSPYMASVIILAFEMALRLGEVCALRWNWVDLNAGVVRIQSSDGFKTKSGATIVKPITRECANVLQRLNDGGRGQHVVRNTKKNPLNAKYTSKRFKKLARACGLAETITFHGLRHGALSLAIANGASIEAVRQFAGHATMSMTQRYVHLNADDYSRDIKRALELRKHAVKCLLAESD
jgi:integrase